MDLFESVPDHLKCPICYELHKEKVFQCKNGHVLCEDCFSKPQMRKCPQCQTPFGTDGIRNRLCEGLLEALKVDCLYSNAGCREKFDRKSIRDHVQNCSFRHARTCINLCKLMGYPDCVFTINRENATEAIQHFQSAHSFIFRDGGSVVGLEYANFEEIVLQNTYCPPKYKNNANSKAKPGNLIGKPIILELKEKIPILIIPFFDRKEESISWIPFCFPSGHNGRPLASPSQIEFTISSTSTDNSTKLLNWRTSPIDILKADKFLPFYGPFRIPVAPLVGDVGKEGSLFLRIEVKKSNDANEAEAQNGQLDYFIVAASEIASAHGTGHVKPNVRPDRQQSEILSRFTIAEARHTRRLSPLAPSFSPATDTGYYPRHYSNGYLPYTPIVIDGAEMAEEVTSGFLVSNIRPPTPPVPYNRFLDSPPSAATRSSRVTSRSQTRPLPPAPPPPESSVPYWSSIYSD